MSILAIDAGNSRIKWGLYVSGRWLAQGWTATAQPHLDSQLGKLPAPKKIIASNVAGSAAAQAIETVCAIWKMTPHIVQAQPEQCGVRNGYATPHQLGSDRWAALIAARHLYPERDVLVVQIGTAVTIDALGADGRFRGGLILPGLALMLDSLARNTASLTPQQHGKFATFPDNTADAMFSGAANAIVGAIEHSFRQLETQPVCLLSGGDMDILLPLLSIPVQPADNLVLEGLLRIAQEP
ncbi:type III pantothenate kinase [Sulfurimicrobium lacus]|uniref:Type III pantothenate kinase n=1 Tax=Sulfurimicrobium lacus TaxID=2715678 RepID=A0A6F8VFJ1_9PROT|nr:type III pantothenate kinase [Sulfurimicrobium lacus]BCB28488.1 type III pantothenate kinase [Sulfurimicrobium lacus]